MKLYKLIELSVRELKSCIKYFLIITVVLSTMLTIVFYLYVLTNVLDEKFEKPLIELYKDGADIRFQDVTYQKILKILDDSIANVDINYMTENTVLKNARLVNGKKQVDHINCTFAFLYDTQYVSGYTIDVDNYIIEGRTWTLEDNDLNTDGKYSVWISEKMKNQLSINVGDALSLSTEYVKGVEYIVAGVYLNEAIGYDCILPFLSGNDLISKTIYHNKCIGSLKVKDVTEYLQIKKRLEEMGITCFVDAFLVQDLNALFIVKGVLLCICLILLCIAAIMLCNSILIIFSLRKQFLLLLQTFGLTPGQTIFVYYLISEMITLWSFALALLSTILLLYRNSAYWNLFRSNISHYGLIFISLFLVFQVILFITFLIKKKKFISKSIMIDLVKVD